MNKKDIGQQLKIFRKKAGYTQAQLAELVNLHEKQISRIESGVHFPTFDNFVKIMNILNVELKDFNNFTKGKNNKKNLQNKLKTIINTASEKELQLYLSIIENIIFYKQK